MSSNVPDQAQEPAPDVLRPSTDTDRLPEGFPSAPVHAAEADPEWAHPSELLAKAKVLVRVDNFQPLCVGKRHRRVLQRVRAGTGKGFRRNLVGPQERGAIPERDVLNRSACWLLL